MKEKVELRVGGHPEAHLMAFALLVVLANEEPEGCAALVLAESGVVVVVEDEFAGEGGGPLRRAHATNGEGVYGVLVAEGHEVCEMGAEEGDHHVASDALLEAVRPAEDPGEAPGEARVREVALERRLELGVAVAGHDGVDNTLEGRVGGAEGREAS